MWFGVSICHLELWGCVCVGRGGWGGGGKDYLVLRILNKYKVSS